MQAYWTFNYVSNTKQKWNTPHGCLGFTVMLWSGTGGGPSTGGGWPTQYNNAQWAQGRQTVSKDMFSRGGLYGSNLGGYASATYTTPITSGEATWPSALYVIVGQNGQNGTVTRGISFASGGLGGYPGGGNGGGSRCTLSDGYAIGAGGGGGATVLLASSTISEANTVLVAGAPGGTGAVGLAGSTWSNWPDLGLTGTTNPPWSLSSLGDGSTVIQGTPFAACLQFYGANGGNTQSVGAPGQGSSAAPSAGYPINNGGTLSGNVAGNGTASAGGAAANTTGTHGTPVKGNPGADLWTTSSPTDGNNGSGGYVSVVGSGWSIAVGGGGGGGGWYGGGGGAPGDDAGGGGGSGSHFVRTSTVNGLPTPSTSATGAAAPPATSVQGGPSGAGGFALFTARVYPTTPGLGAAPAVATTETVTDIAWSVVLNSSASNSTSNSGAAAMQAYRVSYKPSGGSTTALPPTSVSPPAPYTNGVLPALSAGSYTVYVDTQDVGGDWNTDRPELVECSSAEFSLVVSTPVAAPGVSYGTVLASTTDNEGVTGVGIPITLTWSGSRYQAHIILKDANGAVVRDVIRAVTTPSSGSQVFTVSWPDAQGSGFEIDAYMDSDSSFRELWSYEGTHSLTVNLNPPSTPTVSMIKSSDTGSCTFTITDPVGTYPASYFEVWRSVSGGIYERIATNLLPDATSHSQSWTYQSMKTDTAYTFKVRSVSSFGGTADTTTGTVSGS